MLTGCEILTKVINKEIIIEPFDPSRLNPNSYNLRLDNKLKVYENTVLDFKKENPTKEIIIPEEGLILEPNVLYLGSTQEYTETHDLIPCIDGRSSVGRLGINIEISAGFGDIGFCGKWTLEIRCVQPVKIYPGLEIAQIYYFKPEGDITMRYHGRYQGQKEATASRIFKDYSAR